MQAAGACESGGGEGGEGGKTKRAAGACEAGGGAGGYQLLSELISDWEMRGPGTSHDVA